MKLNLSFCAICALLFGGCGDHRGDGEVETVPTGKPALGAHTLLAQDQGKGTAPATTAAITTKPSGSLLLAVSMGRNANFTAPTDRYGNKWSGIGGRNLYANGPFYTAVWSATRAKGGGGHTLSAAKRSDPVDEISLALIEIENGRRIEDAVYAYPKIGSPITCGSVKTTGAATLIAVWGGDGPALSHTAVPGDGFQTIDSYLMLGPTSGVQIAIAVRQVTEPGTYSVSWKASPEQGAACYLIAVQ